MGEVSAGADCEAHALFPDGVSWEFLGGRLEEQDHVVP